MSFLSLERAGGKPVELYVFQRGTEFWRYTDGRSAVTVNGLAYQPGAITRSAQTDSQEESQSTVTVTLHHALPVVAGMLTGPPGYRPATLAIFRYQAGATDKALVARGRISGARWRGATVEVTLLQTASLLQQPVPRLTYLPTCNHVVYDAYCQKNPLDFTYGGNVTSILARGDPAGSPDGPSVLVDLGGPDVFAQPGFFTAGYFSRTIPASDPRFIIAHTVVSSFALIVSMSDFPPDMTLGSMEFTAGCDGSIGTCQTKFDNLANFLGFPYMPTKNPFTQGLT